MNMSEQCCGNCHWFRAYEHSGNRGQCYRHPPVLVVWAPDPNDAPMPNSMRPEVRAGAGCGEWEEKVSF